MARKWPGHSCLKRALIWREVDVERSVDSSRRLNQMDHGWLDLLPFSWTRARPSHSEERLCIISGKIKKHQRSVHEKGRKLVEVTIRS